MQLLPPTSDFLRRVLVLWLAATALCLSLFGCGGQSVRHSRSSASASLSASSSQLSSATGATRPNIVFVLTDDLSLNLLRFMPHVRAMEQRGMTFGNYFVTDSLCCPSRASIFTGNLPHNTHVFTNFGADGGFHAFYARQEEQQTFAVALQQAGYLTGLMGKYLNGYNPDTHRAPDGSASAVPARYVPPGWSEWDVAGEGYPEFDYALNENGSVHYYGHRHSDYLTDVIARRGSEFIDRAASTHRPFFLELATFAPHAPYVPAPQDRRAFPGLKAPRPPSFDVLPTGPPSWLAAHRPLRRRQLRRINRVFRRRAQSVQAVDRAIGNIEEKLRALGLADNSYLVFSSDNGLHTGEYRLMPGKLTAYDTDIHVPLVVVGPGVPQSTTSDAMSENVDLAATFAAIGGGASFPSDGHSLLSLLHGAQSSRWRNAILVEHHGADLHGGDPDYQQPASGSPRTYEAMRTPQLLYVEYDNGEREVYDLRADPFELHNIANTLPPTTLHRLHGELLAMARCQGEDDCWRAMHVHGG